MSEPCFLMPRNDLVLKVQTADHATTRLHSVQTLKISGRTR
jgi:hypothetical protein